MPKSSDAKHPPRLKRPCSASCVLACQMVSTRLNFSLENPKGRKSREIRNSNTAAKLIGQLGFYDCGIVVRNHGAHRSVTPPSTILMLYCTSPILSPWMFHTLLSSVSLIDLLHNCFCSGCHSFLIVSSFSPSILSLLLYSPLRSSSLNSQHQDALLTRPSSACYGSCASSSCRKSNWVYFGYLRHVWDFPSQLRQWMVLFGWSRLHKWFERR
jgi:hypothetical protein